MQKVKVHRYISGKRPEYAQYRSSDEESEDDDFIDRRAQRSFANRGDDSYDASRKRDAAMLLEDSYKSDDAADDPRLRRLARHKSESEDDDDDRERNRESRLRRYKERRIEEPEIIVSENENIPSGSEGELRSDNEDKIHYTIDIERKRHIDLDDGSDDSDELSDDEEIEKRRQRLKNKMLQQRKDEEEVFERGNEEEKHLESSDDVASSYEEESESEEETETMRLKPLFVSKKDRATIAEKEKEAQKQKQLEQEARRLAKERRRQTLRMVEESVKKDLEKTKV